MNYKHIIFDIDGTLQNSEKAVLLSWQRLVKTMLKKELSLEDLRCTLGIPGEAGLQLLGIKDMEKGARLWFEYFDQYRLQIPLFPGIRRTIQELHCAGFTLGVVTSKTKEEYAQDFHPYGLDSYFDTVICMDDTQMHKPNPEPMEEYLRRTGIKPTEALYVGDSVYDQQCARASGVDFAYAGWSHQNTDELDDRVFMLPEELIQTLCRNHHTKQPFLDWLIELQSIAQNGLTYSNNAYDIERFERIREMSAEMLCKSTQMDLALTKKVFCNETGFQTPKMDTRAAIFKDNKILLVLEHPAEKWALPGGWIDVNESIKTNTIKEVKEEAGLDVAVEKLIAVQDRNQHNVPQYAYGILKAFVLCRYIKGAFQKNLETIDSRYFSLDQLPALAEEKTSRKQIEMCFAAYKDPNWETLFD